MRTGASLPMYAQPGAKPAWALIWRHVAVRLQARGLPAPPSLIWPQDPHAVWCARDLFLSQTCARPFRMSVHRTATALGAFDFGLEGCPPGHYQSVIVTRQGETATPQALVTNSRVAVNSLDSQSGYAALAELGNLPAHPQITGSHAASLQAVRNGLADIAALDAVSWRYLQRLPGTARGCVVRMHTQPTPGLPLITGRRHLADPLRNALADAFATAPTGPMRWLGLRGMVPLTDRVYLSD